MMDNFSRTVMNICVENIIEFHWTGGVLVIRSNNLMKILHILDPNVRVLGLDTFSFIGNRIQPHMAEDVEFGHGISPDEAIERLRTWTIDPERWVEITGLLEGEQ